MGNHNALASELQICGIKLVFMAYLSSYQTSELEQFHAV